MNFKYQKCHLMYHQAQLLLTPEEQAWLREHPVLRIAPDPDYPPLESFDEQGNYQGVAADFFRLIVDKAVLISCPA